MPYKDPAQQREFQRLACARRRAEFFEGKSCVDCGATEALELDHVDPATKGSHKIWSWSAERFAVEVAKCVVRCGPCHRERHARERRRHGMKRYSKGCRCDVCVAARRRKTRRQVEAQRRRALEQLESVA